MRIYPRRIESAPYVKTKLKIMSIFSLNAVNLQLERDEWLGNLYQQIKDLKNKPFNYKCRKVLTLNFENENVCKMVAKGISNMYTVREKLEAARLKETSKFI